MYISKVKFNVSLCICKYASAPPHPRHPGDIGDIGDIFRKSLKLLDFLNAHGGDISGDIFLDGDSHAQDTLRVLCTGRFDSMRGTPITKTPRSAGVQTPGPPSW